MSITACVGTAGTYRGQCASTSAQLTVYDDGSASRITPDHDLYELAKVGEVWGTFRRDRNACISEFEVVGGMPAVSHHIL